MTTDQIYGDATPADRLNTYPAGPPTSGIAVATAPTFAPPPLEAAPAAVDPLTAPLTAPAAPVAAPDHVPAPPPVTVRRAEAPAPEGAGPLCDLPYRWRARVMVVGAPSAPREGKSFVFTLGDGVQVPAAPFPLPLIAYGGEGLVQVGEVTHLYRSTGPNGEAEVCAAGTFDLTRPFVPGFVADLNRAAAAGTPGMRISPDLDGVRYAEEPVTGPEGALSAHVAHEWFVRGLRIDGGPAIWPRCGELVLDAALVGVELEGRTYGMRRHHDPRVWRTLVTAYEAQNRPDGGAWEQLASAFTMVGAMSTTTVHDEIAARLLDPADPLDPAALVRGMVAAVAAVRDEDERRGEVR